MLPKEKKKPEVSKVNPILIYGMPKVGKSEAFAKLEKNLILDFEGSTKRIECYKIDVETLKQFYEIVEELKKDTFFEYVTIDTITSMEKIAKDFAEFKYSKTTFGVNWYKEHKQRYLDITNLPNGLGHSFLKDAYVDMIRALLSTNKRIIIIGHVKDSYKDDGGISIQYNDIDLHGMTKRALLNKYIEAIGYVYREKENENKISFVPNLNLVAGGRGNLGSYIDTFSVKDGDKLTVNFKFLEL